MAPDIIERLKASASSISFIYRALTIYPCQIRVHQTLTVLNSNFLQLGRRSGGLPQRTVYPQAVTCQHCDTHYVSRHSNPLIVSPTYLLPIIARIPHIITTLMPCRVE